MIWAMQAEDVVQGDLWIFELSANGTLLSLRAVARSSWSVRSRVKSSVWQSLATRKLHPDAIDYATRVHTSELVPLHIDQ